MLHCAIAGNKAKIHELSKKAFRIVYQPKFLNGAACTPITSNGPATVRYMLMYQLSKPDAATCTKAQALAGKIVTVLGTPVRGGAGCSATTDTKVGGSVCPARAVYSTADLDIVRGIGSMITAGTPAAYQQQPGSRGLACKSIPNGNRKRAVPQHVRCFTVKLLESRLVSLQGRWASSLKLGLNSCGVRFWSGPVVHHQMFNWLVACWEWSYTCCVKCTPSHGLHTFGCKGLVVRDQA